ncbi:MAG: universal stress protein [Pseudomonadota bacterium]
MADNHNTILVVVDDDLEELAALGRATQIAEAFGSGIELFSCVFDTYIAGERLFDSEDLIAAKKKLLTEHHDRLEDIAKPLRDEGFTVSVDVAWDEPAYEGIVRKVLQSKPRMVIRNNHYHHALKRGIFSNDDWNLIRQCPVPLLIARPSLDEDDLLHVCAAIDPMHANDKPADLDQAIIAEAQALAKAANGRLSVLHSYDPAPVIASIGAGTMVPVVADVKGITSQVRAEHRAATDRVTQACNVPQDAVHHIEGSARAVLPAFAIQHNVDVLVMGAVSRGFIQRHIIGNTAERLMDRLSCDLLVVKPSGFETKVKAQSSHRVQINAA